jgi:hypothetical protein
MLRMVLPQRGQNKMVSISKERVSRARPTGVCSGAVRGSSYKCCQWRCPGAWIQAASRSRHCRWQSRQWLVRMAASRRPAAGAPWPAVQRRRGSAPYLVGVAGWWQRGGGGNPAGRRPGDSVRSEAACAARA